MNNETIVSFDNVSFQFVHDKPLLNEASFSVRRGTKITFMGQNGAGKTTTLRTIMGMWKASQGEIEFNGDALKKMQTADIAQLGIAYVPENMGVFSDLSVRENLLLAAKNGPLDTQRLEWIFGFFPALKKFWLSAAGNLSGGQKQMVAIARAMVEPRKLILVDEPTKGLAPSIVQNLLQAFQELKATDTSILLVEQNFNFVKQLGDQVFVMDDGRIVHSGGMQQLADDDELQQQLLGLSLSAHQ